MKESLNMTLNSVSQILFLDQPIFGGLFLLTIAIYSPFQAFTCLLGAVAANTLAIVMKRDREKIRIGLYGYNAALLGLALPIFMEHNLLIGLFTVIGALLTVFLYEAMSIRKVIPLTVPFVLITWFFLTVAGRLPLATTQPLEISFWHTPFLGIGQVFFLDSVSTGIAILAIIALFSIRYAIYIWIGSVIGLLPLLFNVDTVPISAGLISLNSTLCVAAFLRLKPEVTIMWVLIFTVCTAILYPFLYIAVSSASLPNLTFPYNLVVILGLLMYPFFMRKKMKTSTG